MEEISGNCINKLTITASTEFCVYLFPEQEFIYCLNTQLKMKD